VFSAGNSGNGNASGGNGNPDSMASPASAKNVIAVGAIENFRRISNNVVVRGITNRAFLGMTDSSNQVAESSSRGNVGIGTGADFRGVDDTGLFPVTADNWYYSVVNTNRQPISFDVQTILVITNDQGTYYDELKKLNDDLKPNYRYESGTSMSAPVVSGLLA